MEKIKAEEQALKRAILDAVSSFHASTGCIVATLGFWVEENKNVVGEVVGVKYHVDPTFKV